MHKVTICKRSGVVRSVTLDDKAIEVISVSPRWSGGYATVTLEMYADVDVVDDTPPACAAAGLKEEKWCESCRNSMKTAPHLREPCLRLGVALV